MSGDPLPTAPDVSDISGLINMANRRIQYRNLNCKCLWGILPELERLERMVGMQRLKLTVFHQIIYYLQDLWLSKSKSNKMNTEDCEYLHTVITGPPGCGKTSVAEIIGNIYRRIGILSQNGSFTIAKREDFIAPYLGQTAIKTRVLLESCIGGVLFIDEAYSLGSGQQDKDSFSKEAIDTLNAFLSEHKKDFCCIIAGYAEEIQKCFFQVNMGLTRRFPWVHRIDPYSSLELALIFRKKVKEVGWEMNVAFVHVEVVKSPN
jgi:SpoVK/Ycf46/Vps4 family AAA+-type ATPase